MLSVFLPLVAVPPADAEYRVLDVSRREVFAGKLGHRLEQTLTVERDGKRYEVRLSRAHTGIRGSVRSYASGDVVTPEWGARVREIG